MDQNVYLNRQPQRAPSIYHTRFARPPGPLPAALNFHLSPRHEPIRVPTTRTIIIGRSDGGHNVRPDVDLSAWDGYRKGVSRRHALISSQDGYMVLIGLNSSSGTYVNGQETTPGQAVPIFDGDELAFGGVTLRVSFTGVSAPGLV